MFMEFLLNGIFSFAVAYFYNIYNQLSKEPWKSMRFSYFETEDSLKRKSICYKKMCNHLNIYDFLPENHKNKIYYITVYLDEQELKLCYIVNTYFDTDYIHDLTWSEDFKVNEFGDILFKGNSESAEYWQEDNLYSICVKAI